MRYLIIVYLIENISDRASVIKLGGQFGRLYNGAGSGNDQLKGDNI